MSLFALVTSLSYLEIHMHAHIHLIHAHIDLRLPDSMSLTRTITEQ